MIADYFRFPERGAGFVTYTAVKLLRGKAGDVHWMMHLVSLAFLVYFLLPAVERLFKG
jgi:AGZA family xanthine/uracil permease-like MFS transporter